MSRRLPVLAGVAVLALAAGLLAPAAYATDEPLQTPSAPSRTAAPFSTPPLTSPSPTTAPPTTAPPVPPGASPTPSPPGPTPSDPPSPGATPAPSRTAPDPGTSQPAPEPGTDGELPAFGVDDAYWDAFRLLQARQRELAAAERALRAADETLASARGTAARLKAAADAASASAATSRLELDRLVGRLYQYGTPVSAVGALLGAPEDFLAVLDRTHNDDVAAELVVGQVASDDQRAALVRTLLLGADARMEAAARAQQQAGEAVRLARKRLAEARTALAALSAASRSQTAVGTDGCPKADVPGTLRGGAEAIGARRLCRAAVTGAATPQAALALRWAFAHLGAAYACGGAGRMLPWRMDCSSLVARAYHEGARLAVAGSTWAPSTREMVPWDGAALDPHYALVRPADLRPGDLVLYDTGGATYRHVVLYLGPASRGGPAWMLHTNSCGDVAKVEPFWGFPTTGSHTFLVARRVLHLPTDPPLPLPSRVPARNVVNSAS